MIDERWQRVKTLFRATIERPPAERAAFLAAAVGGDEVLRRDVESLLTSDASDVSVLDRVALAAQAVLADLPTVPPTSTEQTQPVLEAGRCRD